MLYGYIIFEITHPAGTNDAPVLRGNKYIRVIPY